MNKVQETLLRLLAEFDGFCHENGLDYVLGHSTALCAARWGRFDENCYSATLFMPQGDFDAAEQLLSLHAGDNRAMESKRTNPFFPYPCMRYVDTSTTFMKVMEIPWVQHPGIGIEVCKLEDSGQEGEPEQSDESAAVAKTKTTVSVQRHCEKPKSFPCDLFEDTSEVGLEGKDFLAPSDINAFLSVQYGRRWLTRDIKLKPLGLGVFVDPDRPFSEYASFCAKEQGEISRLEPLLKKRAALQNERARIRRPLDERRWLYERTVDRVHLQDALLPQKGEILSVYENADFAVLYPLLYEYVEASLKHLRRNVPFAIDRDLYFVLCDVLNWLGAIRQRRKLLAQKEQAFAYLDEVSPGLDVSLGNSPFRFLLDTGAFVRKRDGSKAAHRASYQDLRQASMRISAPPDEQDVFIESMCE